MLMVVVRMKWEIVGKSEVVAGLVSNGSIVSASIV